MIYTTNSVIEDLEHMDRNTAKSIVEDMTDYGYDAAGKWHDPQNSWGAGWMIIFGFAVTIPVWIIAIWAIVRFFFGK